MSDDRIARLQSLLDRVRKNRERPQQSLGLNWGLGVPRTAQSDIATGPAVPARPATLGVAAIEDSTPVLPVVSATRKPTLPGAAGAMASESPAARKTTLSGPASVKPAMVPPSALPRSAAPAASSNIPTLRGTSLVRPESHPPAALGNDAISLDDADLVEVKSQPPPEPKTLPPSAPPDSAARHRVPLPLTQEFDDAESDTDREAPLKTPPPESGRQLAEGGFSEIDTAPSAGYLEPTAEQLGETIDLGLPTAAEVEIDIVQARSDRPSDELELKIPRGPIAIEPPDRAALPTLAPEPEPASQRVPKSAREIAELQPEVTGRGALAATGSPAVIQAVRGFAPQSFFELLEASLRLGG
jgi:hypothetical protein